MPELHVRVDSHFTFCMLRPGLIKRFRAGIPLQNKINRVPTLTAQNAN